MILAHTDLPMAIGIVLGAVTVVAAWKTAVGLYGKKTP